MMLKAKHVGKGLIGKYSDKIGYLLYFVHCTPEFAKRRGRV